ncbi:MAG TPA: 5'/3'-nucleotidase SurE [Acidimicrobiales bacterium]|nr:5'/3'-nucleotidase SurE [Acidimicrobiales bacterium]
MSLITVLVTNDDGFESPGLAALVRAVAGPGRRVVVAAPASDQSGTSAAVAPRPPDGVRIESVSVPHLAEPGFEDLLAYAVDGPPALAVLGELGGPAASASVVASGVNLGPNTGVAVLFSGTVGAAMAAANLGLSGLAVSIDGFEPQHFATATTVAAAALDWLLGAPAGTVLNVNVPDLPVDRLAGVRQAPLATLGTFEAAVQERGSEPFLAQFEIGRQDPAPGTDAALLGEGWVTVTALLGIQADDGVDAASIIERAVSRAA